MTNIQEINFFLSIFAALTVFVVVQVDSLKATSLTGRFSKPLNQTSNSNSTTTSTQVPVSDRLKEILEEVPEDDDGVSGQIISF
jgi:hypothetical protein